MGILGNVGLLYMVILIMLLIIGLGSIGVRLIEYLIGFGKSNTPIKNSVNIKNNSTKGK